nr:LOW QUALITY PROTEIN: maturin [Loxodonta africana]
MDFQQLADVAEKWCSNTPFDLIATEETERQGKIMVPKCKMETAVGSGYRVVAGLSLALLLLLPLRTRTRAGPGGAEARPLSWLLRPPIHAIPFQTPALTRAPLSVQPTVLGQSVLSVARAQGPSYTCLQHVWSESEDCLPFLQLAQDYISSCGKKTLQEVLEKVFKSFRPLLGLPDADDDAFEEYNADVEEEEPEADHPQMGVSQQ